MSSTSTPQAEITSLDNARIKRATALQQRKYRDAEGRFLVEGRHPVTEALADGVVEEVFVTQALAEEFATVAVSVTTVADHVLDKLASSRSPQGVVAVARWEPAALDEVVGRGVLVVCAGVADPGNVGAVIRTADAAGAAGVVLSEGSVDPTNPKAVRAAAGSLTHLPIVVGVTLDAVIASCRRVGQRLVALDAAAEHRIDDPGILDQPVALVFGSEAHGLPEDVLPTLEWRARVPIHGRAESLNLAAAVAVAVYAAVAKTQVVTHPDG